MRKIIAAAASTAMVLGFAGTALALHGEIPAETSSVVAKKHVQIQLDGSIRARGFIEQKDAQDSASYAAYDGRVRLGTTAQVGDQVMGYVQLETGDATKDYYTWGHEDGTTLFNGGTKQDEGDTDLSILQAWIEYSPGMFGVKVGHMPLALGNNLFFDHTGSGDDAILAYVTPSDRTEIGVLTIKFREGQSNVSTDDLDGYVAYLAQKIGSDMSLGVNWTYLHHGAEEPTVTDPILLAVQGMKFHNVGVDFKGKFGMVDLLADVEYQFGDFNDIAGVTVDQDAYAAKLGVRFNIGNGYLGALAGYGSGDDGTDPTTQEQFINFLTDTYYDTIVVGYRLAVPGQLWKNTGLANMMLGQINGGVKGKCPVTGKDLDLKGSISYMQLNEDVTIPGSTNEENEIGTEFDLIATWKLTAGLSYKVEFGYLLTGDAYMQSPTDDPEDAYFLRNGLEIAF